LLNDSGAADSASALNTYAKDAASAANLLASHDYNSEAEEIYRSALQLAPASPDAVLGYVKLLFAQNQFSQAVTAAQAAIAAAPNNELFQSLLLQAKGRMQ
jgi:predicted Zn-dependent protease